MNRIINRSSKFIAILLIISGIGSCAHGPKFGHRGDEGYPAVAILGFRNDSFQPGLEEQLTRYTIEEFLSDGRLPVVNSKESVLTITGQIKSYTRSILSLGNDDDANLYQLFVSTDLEVLDTMSQKTIVHLPNINAMTTFIPLRSSIEFETETDAQNRLMRDLAEEILYQIIDKNPGFMKEYISAKNSPS